VNPGVGRDGKPSTNSAQNLGTSSPRSDRCARPLSTPCSSGPGNGWQNYLLTSGSRFAPSTNSTRAIAPLAGERRACIDVHGRRRRRGAAVADVGDAAAGGIVAGHYLPTPPGSPRLPGVDAPPSPTPSSRWSGNIAATEPRRWWALTVIAAATLMVVPDTSIINLVLSKAQVPRLF